MDSMDCHRDRRMMNNTTIHDGITPISMRKLRVETAHPIGELLETSCAAQLVLMESLLTLKALVKHVWKEEVILQTTRSKFGTTT